MNLTSFHQKRMCNPWIFFPLPVLCLLVVGALSFGQDDVSAPPAHLVIDDATSTMSNPETDAELEIGGTPPRGPEKMPEGPGMGRGPGLGRGPGPNAGLGMGRGPRFREGGPPDGDDFPPPGPEGGYRYRGMRIRETIESPERMAELRQQNPRLADMFERSHRVRFHLYNLLNEYEKIEEPQAKAKFQEQLRPVIKEEFELELDRQRMEIRVLEVRLKQLKEQEQLREKNKERMLERHTREVLRNPQRFLEGPFMIHRQTRPPRPAAADSQIQDTTPETRVDVYRKIEQQ